MGGWSKDGSFYKNTNELIRADNKWLQQQEQNKLLEEQRKEQEKQNKLLEEQNRLQMQQQNMAEQQLRFQEEQLIKEQIKQREKEIEQKIKETEAKIDEHNKDFSRLFAKNIYPIMKESGIKDSNEYYKKLLELYGNKPKENDLKLLDENNDNLVVSQYKIDKYPEEFQNKINAINNIKINNINTITKKLIQIYIIIAIIIGIVTYLTSNEILVTIFTCGIVLFSLIIMVISMRPNLKKQIKKQKEQKKEKIKLLNTEIDKYNKNIKEEKEKWANKINNFEKKRLENFNYELEFALYELSKMEKDLQNKIDNSYKELYNFYGKEYTEKSESKSYTFKFNSYPEDFEEKRKSYWKEKRMKKAQETGTEIFENLSDDMYDSNMADTETEMNTDNDIMNVVLQDSGINKIQVISVIQTITGIGLKEVKKIVDETPSTIRENITKEDAEEIKFELEKIGATVEIIKV